MKKTPLPHPTQRLRHPRALACLALIASFGTAAVATEVQVQPAPEAKAQTMPEVVVTAVHEHSGITVTADPKQPRQPIPASDAADYLKSIPGFSAVRSGGSNSDPVFRGQFGSRLPILTNGTTTWGACPSRMDSPSSYISPETYDELTLVKGPQSVIWGPGASAGVVRFDRTRPNLTESQVQFDASALIGTAGRNDQSLDFLAGTENAYVRFTANHSQAKDYLDGNGRRVPSSYDKWNTDLALGLTPSKDTWMELSVGIGDGEARYGGRGMDGTRFRRESVALRLEQTNITSWLSKLEAQFYYNDADHIMDNFSLREFKPSGGMAMTRAGNPRSTTSGLRIAGTFELSPDTTLVAGVDAMRTPHSKRAGSQTVAPSTLPRVPDAKFANQGMFAELTHRLDESARIVGGLRLDRSEAWRYSKTPVNVLPDGSLVSNHRKSSHEPSGFLRWEQTLQSGTSVYAGIGHVQRFPDYWELISPGNSTADKGNAFGRLKPEKTTQIDVGASFKGDDWKLWLSGYAGVVDDYILFDYSGMGSAARNIKKRMAGLELGGTYEITKGLSAQGTLGYSWAENRTDRRAAPQTPPLEARLGLDYSNGPLSVGALWRIVAAQKRIALKQGNVIGQDFGPSPGWSTLSVNMGMRVNQNWKITAGIDNLFDRNYSEHLNLSGNAAFGYPGGIRINEPGRTFWLRGDMTF